MTDRTADFASLCRDAAQRKEKRLSQRPPGVSTQLSAPIRRRTTPMEAAAFSTAAASISRDINMTAQKLAKLTALVRRSNMFSDPTSEINSMVSDIKNDISNLNQQLENAERFINQKTDSLGSRQSATHSQTIISQMKNHLLQTTKGFKKILEVRQSDMKARSDRKSQYGRSRPGNLGKPLAYRSMRSSGTEAEREALVSNGVSEGSSASDSLPRPGDHGRAGPLVIPRPQLQQLIPDQSYLESRADAVSQIESHMVDLGQIFNKLATMIHEQGEMVERIDDNVEDTIGNIDAGQNQLMRYYESLSSNRLLAMKLFFVLLFFVLFFIVVLA